MGKCSRIALLLGVTASVAFVEASCLDFGSLSGPLADASTADVDLTPDAIADTAAPLDASQDATADAGLSFCGQNPGHLFCDDFDETPLFANWNATAVIDPTGVLDTDTTLFQSFPRSLSATIPGDGGPVRAQLSERLPLVPARLQFSFDLEVVQASVTTTTVTTVAFPNNFALALTLKQASPSLLSFEEAAPNGDASVQFTFVPGISFLIPSGEWKTISVELDFTANTVALTVNGSTQTSTLPTKVVADGGVTTFFAGFGNYSSTPYSGGSVRIDNYVIDDK